MIRKILLSSLSALLIIIAAPVQGQDATSDLLGRINGLRGELGLPGYALNGALSAAAQNHAAWMVSTGQVSHTQPNGSTPSSRAAAFGYASNAVSENIYMGSNASASTAWTWWLNSPIHYRGITNAAYTEVGIGTATGEYGASFVLVFGNPNGWGAAPARAAVNNNNGGGGQAASGGGAPVIPSFVVGVDNLGNIMHEIQPGHTLGEIAFMYGYDWDDLEYIRQINEMTEFDGRNLAVGSVLLIPPWEGTYTPTPGGPPPEEIAPTAMPSQGEITPMPPVQTENAIVLHSDALELQTPTVSAAGSAGAVDTNTNEDLGILTSPEPAPIIAEPIDPQVSTLTPIATNTPQTPAPAVDEAEVSAWVAVTMTPTAQAIAANNIAAEQNNLTTNNDAPQTGLVVPATTEIRVERQIPMWLIFALITQSIIIIGAGFEFWRRRSK